MRREFYQLGFSQSHYGMMFNVHLRVAYRHGFSWQSGLAHDSSLCYRRREIVLPHGKEPHTQMRVQNSSCGSMAELVIDKVLELKG